MSQRMTTQQLRDTFHVTDLFAPGELRGVFTDLDRLVVGGVMPVKPVELPNHKETGRAFFLERRELGAINVGGAGRGACGRQNVFARPAGLRLSADGHQVGHVREQGREESGEVLFPELSGARGASRRDDEAEGCVARAAGFAGGGEQADDLQIHPPPAASKAASS